MLGIRPSPNPLAADRQQNRWADEPARGLARPLTARGWPLAIILAIQATLSLRLGWTATAFQDEALYLSWPTRPRRVRAPPAEASALPTWDRWRAEPGTGSGACRSR